MANNVGDVRSNEHKRKDKTLPCICGYRAFLSVLLIQPKPERGKTLGSGAVWHLGASLLGVLERRLPASAGLSVNLGGQTEKAN